MWNVCYNGNETVPIGFLEENFKPKNLSGNSNYYKEVIVLRSKNRKGTKIFIIALFMSMALNQITFAGEWKSDEAGQWYQNDDGSYPVNTWQWIDGNGDGVAESYYFDENGYLLTNVTKDGYTVNGDGAWTVNGVVQTQGQTTATNQTLNYDEQYPLKGRVEKYLGNEEGFLCWYWAGPHVIREGVVPAGMTGMTYVDQKSVEHRDATYHAGLSQYGMDVLAKLSGYPYKNAASDTPEANALLNEVKEFMNSFDWKNASDLEKATRICNRIHEASYDRDAANEAITTGWSESLSYGAYGCLVNGKAVCQGYTEAANLLAICVGLQTMEMGDIGHTYPLFLVDGIWLANEPTTQNKYFTVADVYEYNPGYRLMLQIGDTSDFNDVTKYQMIGQYCIQTGYTMPEESQVKKFGNTGTVFGKISIDFKSEYR